MNAAQSDTKIDTAARMLARKNGASITELSEKLETSPRNVRGLITRLKRRGVRVTNLRRGSGKFRAVQGKISQGRRSS